jgi:hypothetical protein
MAIRREVKTMKAELRADGLHISGYVNVPGRQSRPVVTPRGRVIEIIEQRAFQRAIDRAGNIRMLLDHDPGRVLAETRANTLMVREDAVGLRAESVVTDPEVIDGAKKGLLRGWSFNIKNPRDTIEERADGLPIRHITDLDMDEVTLVMHKVPVYSSTSIEIRAGEEESIEYRSDDDELEFEDKTEPDDDPDDPDDKDPDDDPDGDEPKEKPQDENRAIIARFHDAPFLCPKGGK